MGVRLAMIACSLIVFTSATLGQTIQWLNSFDQALDQARRDNKPVFLLSTGSDWCHACVLLEQQVLQQADFQQAVADQFVFVKLINEIGEEAETQARLAEQLKVSEKYLCHSVPTTLLLDPQGQPFKISSGYDSKERLPGYLKQIRAALDACRKRDHHFEQASIAQGVQRAEHLDAALASIDSLLESYEDHEDDTLLFFYDESIKEILSLVEPLNPIAQKYLARQATRQQFQARQQIFESIQQLRYAQKYDEAIRLIDSQLLQPVNTDDQIRLQRIRLSILESTEHYDDALAYVRQILQQANLSAEQRVAWKSNEISLVYSRLERHAEGLALIDDELANANDDIRLRRVWLFEKSQMLYSKGPVDQSITTFRELLKLLKPEDDRWCDAVALLARELRRAKQYDEAMTMAEEALKCERNPYLLMDAVEISLGAQKHHATREYVNELQGELNNIRRSGSESEREGAVLLQTRLDRAVQALPALAK